jgi:superfamily I DNA/RNA helicase
MATVGAGTGLPVPKGKQKEVVALAGQGHTVVLGTAGSGKTTMAIHRAAFLGNPMTTHAGRVLLVTYNRALVAYLRRPLRSRRAVCAPPAPDDVGRPRRVLQRARQGRLSV